MVGEDHIWGLPLLDQRSYCAVESPEFLWCQVHPGTSNREELLIMSLGGFCIVIVLCMDRAFTPWFIASITDERGFLDPGAVLPFKSGTDVIASVAGAAESIAEDEFPTGVCFFAVITMDTEVIGVIKTSPVP